MIAELPREGKPLRLLRGVRWEWGCLLRGVLDEACDRRGDRGQEDAGGDRPERRYCLGDRPGYGPCTEPGHDGLQELGQSLERRRGRSSRREPEQEGQASTNAGRDEAEPEFVRAQLGR